MHVSHFFFLFQKKLVLFFFSFSWNKTTLLHKVLCLLDPISVSSCETECKREHTLSLAHFCACSHSFSWNCTTFSTLESEKWSGGTVDFIAVTVILSSLSCCTSGCLITTVQKEASILYVSMCHTLALRFLELRGGNLEKD